MSEKYTRAIRQIMANIKLARKLFDELLYTLENIAGAVQVLLPLIGDKSGDEDDEAQG